MVQDPSLKQQLTVRSPRQCTGSTLSPFIPKHSFERKTVVFQSLEKTLSDPGNGTYDVAKDLQGAWIWLFPSGHSGPENRQSTFTI